MEGHPGGVIARGGFGKINRVELKDNNLPWPTYHPLLSTNQAQDTFRSIAFLCMQSSSWIRVRGCHLVFLFVDIFQQIFLHKRKQSTTDYFWLASIIWSSVAASEFEAMKSSFQNKSIGRLRIASKGPHPATNPNFIARSVRRNQKFLQISFPLRGLKSTSLMYSQEKWNEWCFCLCHSVRLQN